MAGKVNICLDVGGTKVLGAISNKDREIVYRLKKKSKKRRARSWSRKASCREERIHSTSVMRI